MIFKHFTHISIIIDDCFVVSDIKIIQGNNGLFISMPSKKRKNGTFRDIAHPLNNQTRQRLEEQIIGEYRDMVTNDPTGTTLRRLEESLPAEDEAEPLIRDREILREGEDTTWS